MQPKIKVKTLLGSPFLISEEPKDQIGSGSYARVVKAYNTQNLDQKLVAKIISLKDPDRASTIKAEIQVLKTVEPHPNLLNCIKMEMSSENNFYLIMEYCNGGTLETQINKRVNGYRDTEIRQFLFQFCEGYKNLMKANLIHRDIKPDNIMINNGIYKIADFGFSKVIEIVPIINNVSTKGTPLYMAPELLKKQGSNKVDVFSLGIILYRMAYKGAFPFYNPNKRYKGKEDYINKMVNTPLIFPTRPIVNQSLKDLITKMLQKEYVNRISWQQIFAHPFLVQQQRQQLYKSGMTSTVYFNKQLQITNKSVLNVNFNHKPPTPKNFNKNSVISQQSSQSNSSSLFEDQLIIQPIIKNTSTKLRRSLYTIKRMYTLVEHISRRLLKQLDNKSNSIPVFIKKTIIHVISSGLQYALYQIKQLQSLSGSWSEVQSQIKSLQYIFNQDRQILTHLLLKVTDKQRYMQKQFQLALYQLLTQYSSYSQPIRKLFSTQIRFMIDLYDYLNGKQNENDDRVLEQYIKDIQTTQHQQLQKYIFEQLKKKGLFLY